jgi:hypothetical protein
MKRYIRSSSVNPSDLHIGDVVQVKGNPKNPYNDNWCYEGIITDMKDGWWKIMDEDGYQHQFGRNQYGDPIFTRIDKDIKLPGELFKHTFFGEGEHHSKQEVIDFLRNTDKPIKYTYGLGYRNPTTHNKPVSLQEALDIVEKEFGMLDVEEHPKYVHLNAYSENDMW